MIIRLLMQRIAEPLRMTGRHDNGRGPAAGGKRRAGAQPLTPSTKGMLDGGEGATDPRSSQPCIGPFAHGDQARRAQGSRGPGDQHDDARVELYSTTRVRNPLDQHKIWRPVVMDGGAGVAGQHPEGGRAFEATTAMA